MKQDSATVTITLSVPQKIHKYSICTANDQLDRSPKSWELWVLRKGDAANKWKEIHAVAHEDFRSPFETREYELNDYDTRNELYSAVQLRITSCHKPGDGIQLSQFMLYSSDFKLLKKIGNNIATPLITAS